MPLTFGRILSFAAPAALLVFFSFFISCMDWSDDASPALRSEGARAVPIDDDDDSGDVFNLDFESDAVGSLPDAWLTEYQSGESTATVEEIGTAHNHVLMLQGDIAEDDAVTVRYPFAESSGNFWIEFLFITTTTAHYAGVLVNSMSDGYLRPEVEAYLLDNGNLVVLIDSELWTTTVCGQYTTDAWHHVAFWFDAAAGTYDVWLDDELGDCNDMPMLFNQGGPLAAFDVTDIQYAGNGGAFAFDEFKGYFDNE